MLFRFTFIYFLCLLLFACSENSINENKSSQITAKSPLHSVTGETCPVSESDVFTLENKNSFSECEVRKNPDLFNEKIIRIKSNYGFMIHGALLSDSDGCPALSKSIDESISVEFQSEAESDFIDKIRTIPFAVETVGKFSVSTPSRESDSIEDRTPYRFEIVCLEKVGKSGK